MDDTSFDMTAGPDTKEVKKFLFERSFDDDAFGADPRASSTQTAEGASPAPGNKGDGAEKGLENGADTTDPPVEEIIETVFSEDELNAAKQDSYMDGHADGFREGHAEAMETLNKQLNDLLERIEPKIASLGIEQGIANERAQANMVRIVKDILAKLLPVYEKVYGPEEALAVVSDCLAELQDPGRLTIRLSEDNTELLGTRLEKLADNAGFEGQLRMIVDETLGPSDVTVNWGAGGAERRYDSIREEIDNALDRAVSRAEAQVTAQEGESLEETEASPDSGQHPTEDHAEPNPETYPDAGIHPDTQVPPDTEILPGAGLDQDTREGEKL